MMHRILIYVLSYAMVVGGLNAEPREMMGDYLGGFINPPKNSYQDKNPSLAAHVVVKKDSLLEIQIFTEFDRRAHYEFKQEVSFDGGPLRYKNQFWNLSLKDGTLSGTLQIFHNHKKIPVAFELLKTIRRSPTLGKKAPHDAIELFSNANLKQWEHGENRPATWKVLKDGVVECYPRRFGNKKGGDLRTKQLFKDCEIHLEFKTPYEPNKSGQGRGNSGLFIQSEYEVQILDSYGSVGDWAECGALYRVSPPKVNMCAPPEQWQTYDIIFRAAKYDAHGTLLANPEITVSHNGKLIHKAQELFEVTQYAEKGRRKRPVQEAGYIKLQDHGHAVQYRNLWIRPLEP
jgi:hypothetical protein